MTPHHDGSALYVSDPAPAVGDTVTVFLRAPASVRTVHVRSTPDGEPSFAEAVPDRGAGGEIWWRASVPVRNPVTRYRWLLDGARWLNALGTAEHDVPDAYDFRLAFLRETADEALLVLARRVAGPREPAPPAGAALVYEGELFEVWALPGSSPR